ncbi:hypothetical protein GCM10022254_50020 [Actinomadura meridiana]|uniref:Ketosynthase family 3 (KS3) domain-containing protein n=1 Tax=Actinomadura meridiana TaxID=559626 RepID=A0ABP8CCP1_9ACTN
MSENREPIAIVGAGAVFPGAGSAAELWHNVLTGVDAITDVPAARWDPALYYDADAYERPPESDRFYCKRGGFVDEVATFDPTRFGIAPAAVPGMEPDQLLALRAAGDAIVDAGGAERLPDRSRVGVVIGRGGYLTAGAARFDQRVRTAHQVAEVLAELVPELGERRLDEIRRAFRDRLDPDGPGDPSGLVPSLAAARIADRFDLRGPAYTLDAACASALLAVEHAVRALRSGQVDAMLAGAVHHAQHATVWGMFTQMRALSPTGTIRPFDRAADGTLLAEGTGIVLLKRLSDAERGGDHVYAVILGAGSASDGRAAADPGPLMAGQVLAVERAWRAAGLDPAEPGAVGLVEAHGAATPAGDAAELATLRRVFGTGGPPIGLGTVKSMIGHAMPAAGIAGLIKAACALRDGVLPPTLHVDDPHPALADGRLRPVREAAEWERHGGPRRAVVNAFGFGGANAHVILEEPPPNAARRTRRPSPSTATPDEGVLRLAARTKDELAVLLGVPDEDLLARTSEDVPDLPCRLAVVAPTPRRLDLARAVVQSGTAWRGRSDVWFSPRPLLADGGRVAFLLPWTAIVATGPCDAAAIEETVRDLDRKVPDVPGPEPDRFGELIDELYRAERVRVFVQVGPENLVGLVADALGDRDHLVVAAGTPEQGGTSQLRRVMAALWAEGHGASPSPSVGVRLDLGTPLVRLDGAVPPLRLASETVAGPASEVSALTADDLVMAELDALLSDAANGAQAVLDALGDRPPAPPGRAEEAPDAGATPVAVEPIVPHVFSLDTMPYLEDYCVFPQAPGWTDMSDRFPIVPLATLLDVLAGAARGLLPGMVVIGFEKVRAVRWITAAPPTTADIRTHLVEEHDRPRRVKVVVQGHADGTVLLADHHPTPPAPDRTPLTVEGPPIVTAERLYEERWMFHGPRFQGITEITALAEDGVRALLTALPAPGALLDSAGQLCGHWIQVYGDTNQTVFPVAVERLSLYGPLPSPGERLVTTVWNQSLTDTTMRCSAELVHEDGTVWARIDGWTTHRFYTDEALWRMKFTAEVSGTGEPQPGGWCLARRRWDGTASRDLLMRQYLCAGERAEYEALPPFAQGPWLLGRIAAKDAVRDHLWRNGHGPLFPAELTVHEGPTVTGPFDEPLTISIASDAELGVALVRTGREPTGIGLAQNEKGARLRAAEQAVLQATEPGSGRSEPVVTVADAERLLIAAHGTVTTVETREIDGHVVAWTVADGGPDTTDMEETRT